MSEETPPSEPASESVPQQPVSAPPKKNKRNLLLMIIAVIVAVLLVSVVLLAVDWGGDDEEPEVERELQVTIHPSSVSAEAGEEVELYVTVDWVNVDDEDDTVSLDADSDVEYRWSRNPLTLGSFDLTGRRYANLTVQEEAGTGTVSCEVTYGEEVETVTASVTVAAPYLASVSIVPATKTLAIDEEGSFTATAYDSVGGVMTGVTFAWTVFGLDSGDYTLSATTGATVTFSPNAEPSGEILLNATGTAGGISETGTSEITIGTGGERTLEYRFYDMFQVPFGEWYDMRPDENPWTEWEGAPYIYDWEGAPVGNIWSYTNLRLDITGRNMTEINMNERPQFLPQLGTTVGGTAVIDWYWNFCDYDDLDPWPAIDAWNDGWITWLTGTTTLDMEAAMSVLGMPAAEWESFDTWWSTNGVATSNAYLAWLNYEGDERLDIFCAYEYPFADLDWSLDAEKVGDEVVVTQHLISWGMEALMSRWLNESFMDDSEYWYEDFSMQATIGPERTDLDISCVMEYGAYAYVTAEEGDPCWMWEAMMMDYIESTFAHPFSRYDLYADKTYENVAPGSPLYGDWMVYDYAPSAMNLSDGETLIFEWPEGDLPFLLHVQPGEYSVEWGPMTVDYAEPMGVDFPGQIDIDTDARTLTYHGPIDMFDWSKTQTRCAGLESEWDRLGGIIPYGCPTVEFRLTGPPELAQLDVIGIADPIVQGETSDVTVRALDQYGDVVTDYVGQIRFESNDTLATLPADYTFQLADAGVHTFTDAVSFGTVGEFWVSANDTSDDTIFGVQADITVTEAPEAASIEVTGVTSPIFTGTPSSFTITILDQFGDPFPDYEGTVEFSSSDGAAELPGPTALDASDLGTREFVDGVTFWTEGTHDLTAADQDDATISGSQTGIIVNLAPHAASYLIEGITDPSYALETQSYMTITVMDQYDDPFPSYTGDVTIECTDGAATYPTAATFDVGDNGVITFSGGDYIEFGTEGTQTVTVTDDVDGTITGSVDVEVLPEAVATSYDVDVDPMTVGLGPTCTVTVDVYDQYARLFTPYDGTIQFSVDPSTGVTVPVDHTFVPGVDDGHYVTDDELAFSVADTYSLTVTDSAEPTLTATVSGIVATDVAIVLDHFVIELEFMTMDEGTPCDITVTAYNQFDNVFDDYDGTVEFSTDAVSGATLPSSDLTFDPADNGVKTWTDGVVFDDPGTFSITVTDSVAGVDDTLENIEVTDLVPTTLVIEGAPASVDSGDSFTLTVSVYDQNDDLEIDYTGTVQFSSSDVDAGVVLPDDYTFTSGDAGTHTFTDEFTLQTPGDQTITADDGTLSDIVTVNVAQGRTLDHTVYDMFAEPWGPWWTPRVPNYGTEYIITSGTYNTMLYLVQDAGENSQGMIMAPYRWSMDGVNLPELNTGMPQFMPLDGPTSVTGDPSATMDIYFQYINQDWWDDYWLAVWSGRDDWSNSYQNTIMGAQDGYILGTTYEITMNRAAAEMWLDMPQGDDPATWWTSNHAAYLASWDAWILSEANTRLDIYCGYDDRYYNMGTMMELTVDGTDVVLEIGHFSWGYEALMCRWLDDDEHSVNILNHQPWYEDFSMSLTYSAEYAQMTMDSVCQWSMFAVKANESVEDDPAWVWQPIRLDYIESTAQHPDSEYDEYAPLTYQSWNAGDLLFGTEELMVYDCTPTILELDAGESLTFVLPTATDVIGYQGTSPGLSAYVDLIVDEDPSGFDAIREDGEMSLGYYVTNPAGGGADLDSMMSGNVLTIEGPQVFDQVRHSPDGPLYHGAPWIEFDITPATMKAVESAEPVVAEPVAQSPSGAAATGASTTSELLAVMVVVGAAMLAVAALGCSVRRQNSG